MTNLKINQIISIIILCFSVNQASALSFSVIGKNREVLLQQEKLVVLPLSVGQISLDIFNQEKVPYVGGVYGFAGLFGIEQDVEVISDSEMKAYGWCYSVDGLIPASMADQLMVDRQESVLEWFYAYAHYKNGIWVGQCVKEK